MTENYRKTKAKEQILCSRCNQVANPNTHWEHDWPNYGRITLGASSVIQWSLLERVAENRPFDSEYTDQPIVQAVISGDHPAIKNFGYQEIQIEWAGATFPKDINREYRLCLKCQKELREIIGEFFFKNIPAPQPIKK